MCKWFGLVSDSLIVLGGLRYVPYSGYNLRGAISANHQISHLEVIFAIINFANHSIVLRGRINLRA